MERTFRQGKLVGEGVVRHGEVLGGAAGAPGRQLQARQRPLLHQFAQDEMGPTNVTHCIRTGS